MPISEEPCFLAGSSKKLSLGLPSLLGLKSVGLPSAVRNLAGAGLWRLETSV